jgi:hypothetical protein
VFQKNFTLVLKRFDFGHDGHTEQGANFRFEEGGAPEADMLLDNAAFGIQKERCGQGRDSAVLNADVIGSHGHGIVDAGIVDVLLYLGGVIVVDIEADDLEAVLISVLQNDKVGNFGAARSAPGGPKIQKNDFALQCGDGERLAIERREFEVGRTIRVANETNDRFVVLLRGSESRQEESKP